MVTMFIAFTVGYFVVKSLIFIQDTISDFFKKS